MAFARQVSATDNGESFQNLVAGNQNHCAIYWKCALCKLLVTGDQKLLYNIGIKVIKVYKNKQNTVQIGTYYTEKVKPNVLIHYPIYSFYILSKTSPKFANLPFHHCNSFNLVRIAKIINIFELFSKY